MNPTLNAILSKMPNTKCTFDDLKVLTIQFLYALASKYKPYIEDIYYDEKSKSVKVYYKYKPMFQFSILEKVNLFRDCLTYNQELTINPDDGIKYNNLLTESENRHIARYFLRANGLSSIYRRACMERDNQIGNNIFYPYGPFDSLISKKTKPSQFLMSEFLWGETSYRPKGTDWAIFYTYWKNFYSTIALRYNTLMLRKDKQ